MGANAVTTVPLYASGDVLTASNLNITNSGIPVFATTVTRDAAFGGTGEKVLAQGQMAFIEATNATQYYDGSAWQTLVVAPQIATFNETQANGTAGGASVATTWTTRVLNTTVINGITGCSLASNQITLPAGTFIVTALSPMRNTNNSKIRLYNVTDASITAVGNNTSMDSSGGVGGIATLQTQFTIAASKAFAVQYYATSAVASFGLGSATSAGTSEIYTSIQIEKIA